MFRTPSQEKALLTHKIFCNKFLKKPFRDVPFGEVTKGSKQMDKKFQETIKSFRKFSKKFKKNK